MLHLCWEPGAPGCNSWRQVCRAATSKPSPVRPMHPEALSTLSRHATECPQHWAGPLACVRGSSHSTLMRQQRRSSSGRETCKRGRISDAARCDHWCQARSARCCGRGHAFRRRWHKVECSPTGWWSAAPAGVGFVVASRVGPRGSESRLGYSWQLAGLHIPPKCPQLLVQALLAGKRKPRRPLLPLHSLYGDDPSALPRTEGGRRPGLWFSGRPASARDRRLGSGGRRTVAGQRERRCLATQAAVYCVEGITLAHTQHAGHTRCGWKRVVSLSLFILTICSKASCQCVFASTAVDLLHLWVQCA